MNLNAQSLLLPNAQWPFTYPYKSYDFAIHPAFLQTACRVLPSPQYPVALEHSQTTTPKVDKFSIDAILKKDSDNEREVKDTCVTNSYDSANVVNDEMELACRRYQRLYEIGHPYLSPQHQTAGSDKTYLQKHLPALKHFSDRSRAADKAEKKASQLPETWSKQTKGKRVRTIFTPEQLERMEAEFERQQYMVGTERYYLASALNLTEAQVKVWFQNRRIKWRKQHLEQQQAKLKSLNMYKDIDSGSESDSEDTLNHSDDINLQSHAAAISDPFQSPKEERGTQ